MSEKDKEPVETNEGEQTPAQEAGTEEANKPVKKDEGADDTAADEAGSQEKNEGSDQIDYDAEFERLKKEKEQWKQAALNAKDKLKRKGKSDDDVTSDFTDVDDQAVEVIREAVKQEIAPLQQEMLSNTIESILASLSDNPSEQRLIRFHYENSINKTGLSKSAIEYDLQLAQALANRQRILKENEELKISLKNRRGMKNTSLGNNQSQADVDLDVSNLKFSEVEMSVIRRAAERNGISVQEYIKKNISQLKQ